MRSSLGQLCHLPVAIAKLCDPHLKRMKSIRLQGDTKCVLATYSGIPGLYHVGSFLGNSCTISSLLTLHRRYSQVHALKHRQSNSNPTGAGNPYYILLQVQGNPVVTVVNFQYFYLFCSNSRVIIGNDYYILLQTTRESTLSRADATTCYSPFWKKCSKCMVRVVKVTCLVVQPYYKLLHGSTERL